MRISHHIQWLWLCLQLEAGRWDKVLIFVGYWNVQAWDWAASEACAMVQCWSIPFAREGSKWAIEISILLWWPRAVSLYSQGWGDSVPVRIAISCSLPCSIDWFEISEQIFLKALYIVITTFYVCFSLIVRSKHRAFIWWFRNYNRSGYCRPSMWFHHVSQTPGEGGYTIAVNYCKSICILLLSSVSLQLVNYFFFYWLYCF